MRSAFSSPPWGDTLDRMMRVRARWCASAVLGVVLSIAGTAAAQPAAQPAPQRDQAQLAQALEHMTAGSLLYNDPSGPQGAKCEGALVEFAKAYELSGSWKALRATAICELKLERDGAALSHFEEVVRLAGDQLDGQERTQIENDIRALKTATAYLKVTSNQPNVRLAATRHPSQGLTITNRYAVTADGVTIGIHPGQYTFTATVDGFPDMTWRSEASNGSRLEHHFDFVQKVEEAPVKAPQTEVERPVPITVWIFTGLTGASAVTSGVLMGLAKAANDDFEEQNGTGASAAELDDLRSDVVTKNIVADVFLGVTAASFATTLIFYFTRPEVPVEEGAHAWLVVPSVGPEAAGATFFTSF